MYQVMHTKLLPPRIHSKTLERQRIMTLFPTAHRPKLVLLTAPAGYGKTVAALQYLSRLDSPWSWYQLDSYDNDPVVFIEHFTAGLRHVLPDLGPELLQMISQRSMASYIHIIVVSIVNELASSRAKGLTIFLDDYQYITSPFIHQFVQELLDNLPADIQIVISSRILPPLSISKLKVSGEMLSISGQELSFNSDDISSFLAEHHIESTETLVRHLMDITNGWPAALRLLAENNIDLSAVDLRPENVYDYLSNEILCKQSMEIQDFLRKTSILKILTPEMCNTLLGREDSEKLLEYLEKELFILTPATGRDKYYRYNPLFREFLERHIGADRVQLLSKAGNIAELSADFDSAINYYSAAGCNDELLALVIKAGKAALALRQWHTVDCWLKLLSTEQLASNSRLSLMEARVRLYQGRLDEAELSLARAFHSFKSQNDEIGMAECNFLQAKILNRNGSYEESLNLLKIADSVLQKEDPSLRFEIMLEKALLFIRMGRLSSAKELLHKGLQVSEKQEDVWVTSIFLEGLGNTYYMLGEFTKALDYYQKSARFSPNGLLPDFFADFSGFIYEEMGDISQAISYLESSISRKEEAGMNEALLPAYYQLGSIYTDIGELERSEEIYRMASQLINTIGGERFFLLLHRLNYGRNEIAKGNLSEALSIMRQVMSDAGPGVVSLICQVYYCSVLLQTGNFAQAEEILTEALKSGIEFSQVLTHSYFLMASIKFASEDYAAGSEYAKKLLDYSAKKNFVQIYIYMFDNFQHILQYGLENEIEVPFVQQVLIHLGEKGLELIREMAVNENPLVRAHIIFPLSQLDSCEAVLLLRSLAKDPDKKVARLAAQCLLLSDGSVMAENEQINASVVTEGSLLKPEANTWHETGGQEHLLEVNMLGAVRIFVNGNDISSIHWRFTKSRDLLLYLCHCGRPVTISQILEALWPKIPLEKAMNMFYGALHWLRKTLSSFTTEELVIYSSKTCQLLPSFYATDKDQFISLADTGVSKVNQLPTKNVLLLEKAAALYQGEYLSTLDYPWITSDREYLKRIHLETVIKLAHSYMKNNDYLNVVNYLEPLAEENPLREEIFSLLMSAFAGLDDRLGVIRSFQRLKANLNEELGIEPELEITRLYYQLCGYSKKGLFHSAVGVYESS